MKNMAVTLKQINLQAADAGKNKESIVLCDSLLKSIEASQKEMPDVVAALPEAEQKPMNDEYVDLLKKLATKVAEIKANFESDNNAEAIAILGTMGEIQKAGHTKFKKK